MGSSASVSYRASFCAIDGGPQIWSLVWTASGGCPGQVMTSLLHYDIAMIWLRRLARLARKWTSKKATINDHRAMAYHGGALLAPNSVGNGHTIRESQRRQRQRAVTQRSQRIEALPDDDRPTAIPTRPRPRSRAHPPQLASPLNMSTDVKCVAVTVGCCNSLSTSPGHR